MKGICILKKKEVEKEFLSLTIEKLSERVRE